MNEGVEIKSIEIKPIEIKPPPILGTSTELVLSLSSSCCLVLDLLALQAVGEPLFVATENALGGLMRTIHGILLNSLLLLCPSNEPQLHRGPKSCLGITEGGGAGSWLCSRGAALGRNYRIQGAEPDFDQGSCSDPSLILAGCCSVVEGGCSHVCTFLSGYLWRCSCPQGMPLAKQTALIRGLGFVYLGEILHGLCSGGRFVPGRCS